MVVAGFMALSGGRALAKQVGCGDTITKDTKLKSDLIGCAGSGIVIGADGITLDLNGHTVEGDGGFAADVGIDNSAGYDRVTIQRGLIRGFQDGIVLSGTVRNVLRKDTVFAQGSGVRIVGDRNRLARSFVSGGSFGGVTVVGDENQIVGNAVSRSDGGITIGGAHNYVRQNRVTEGSVQPGILVFRGANVIEENFVSKALFGGIVVSDATGTRVEANVATESGSDGIRVEGSVTVTGNTAYDNYDYGIEADPEVIDGGGNRAFDNGNALQCLNVVCN